MLNQPPKNQAQVNQVNGVSPTNSLNQINSGLNLLPEIVHENFFKLILNDIFYFILFFKSLRVQ